MKYEEIQNIFQTPFLAPWEHDYYAAYFAQQKSSQEFLDHAYLSIENLSGIWYKVSENMVYFVVAKGTVIPEDFCESLQVVTDVPEQTEEQGEGNVP